MKTSKFIGIWFITNIIFVVLLVMSFIFPPLAIVVGLPAVGFMVLLNIGFLISAIWIYVNNPPSKCIGCWSRECSKSRKSEVKRGEFYDPDYEDDDYSAYEDGYKGGFTNYKGASNQHSTQSQFNHIGDSSFDTGQQGFNQSSMGYY